MDVEHSKEYTLEILEESPLYGDDWTEANQEQLYTWRRQCKEFAKEHHVSMLKQKARYVTLKVCITVLAVASAVIIAFNKRYNSQALSDTSIVSTGLISLFTGIDYLLSPQEKYVGHKQAASSYAHLARMIKYQCTLPPKKRPDVEVAYVIATSEMFNIETTAPHLGKRFIEEKGRSPDFKDLQ